MSIYRNNESYLWRDLTISENVVKNSIFQHLYNEANFSTIIDGF